MALFPITVFIMQPGEPGQSYQYVDLLKELGKDELMTVLRQNGVDGNEVTCVSDPIQKENPTGQVSL